MYSNYPVTSPSQPIPGIPTTAEGINWGLGVCGYMAFLVDDLRFY